EDDLARDGLGHLHDGREVELCCHDVPLLCQSIRQKGNPRAAEEGAIPTVQAGDFSRERMATANASHMLGASDNRTPTEIRAVAHGGTSASIGRAVGPREALRRGRTSRS